MARVPVGAALAACALALVADAGDPSASPGRCQVRHRQAYRPEERAVELRLANGCRFPVSCELTWEVRCDDEDPVSAGETVAVAARGSAAAIASIGRCEDDWAVADVRWECEEVR